MVYCTPNHRTRQAPVKLGAFHFEGELPEHNALRDSTANTAYQRSNAKDAALWTVYRTPGAHSPYERELNRDLLLAAAVVGDEAPVKYLNVYRV
jgi:hypothetical protein